MKTTIIREYLESLTESEELDSIFPILLEAMNFKIVSTPKMTKGLAQYGKDVVATGVDAIDGVEKRFYFEIKGGADRHITTTNFQSNDGIRESLIEAKDRPFNDPSNPKFSRLPIKIVLVHNGIIRHNVKETFDGFIEREFPALAHAPKIGYFKRLCRKRKIRKDFDFERWDIFRLTELFNQQLFGEYLLSSEEDVLRFKRVLVQLGNPQSDFNDFYALVDGLLRKLSPKDITSTMPRGNKMIFASLRMVAFVVYTYAFESKNLEPAKRSLPFLLLRTWAWVIRNKLHGSKEYLEMFSKLVQIYLLTLEKYFGKLIPVAILEHGLHFDQGGRYEQIGYPIRVLDFLGYLAFYSECLELGLIEQPKEFPAVADSPIFSLIVFNNESARPLLDNHSIEISLILNSLIKIDKAEAAAYLSKILDGIIIGKEVANRLPDAGNNIEVVVRYIVTGKKSVYFKESTSHLLGMIAEYFAVLGMRDEYSRLREFVTRTGIHLAVFVPFADADIPKLLPEVSDILETLIFQHQIAMEGYQSEIILDEDFDHFVEKTKSKAEFIYDYETDKLGLGSLRTLAHLFYRTPFFPDQWRSML